MKVKIGLFGNNKINAMLAIIIWYSVLVALIFLIGYRLFYEIIISQERKKSKSDNPFEQAIGGENDKFEKKDYLELEYGPTIPMVALTASFMMWGMLYHLHKEFNEYLVLLMMYKGFSIPVVIIFFLAIGLLFMDKLLNDIGEDNDFHDSNNIDIIKQRAAGAVTTYLSFLLGALVFTFLSDISIGFNLVRFVPMSFLLGSSLYLLLRQKPSQRKARGLFMESIRVPDRIRNFKKDVNKVDIDI